MATGTLLLLYAAIAICALIVLIARYRLNPFITLTLVSLGLALAAGMPAGDIVAAYEQGVGRTLMGAFAKQLRGEAELVPAPDGGTIARMTFATPEAVVPIDPADVIRREAAGT